MNKLKKKVWCVAICLCLLLQTGCVTLTLSDGVSHRYPQGVQPAVPQTQPDIPPTQSSATEAPATAPVTEAQTGVAAAGTWNHEQILSYLASAVNAAKSEVSAYTLDCTLVHSVSLFDLSSEPMRDIVEEAITHLNYSKADVYTVADGTAVSANETLPLTELLLPAGKPFALEKEAIESARASFDGENVIIVMRLKDAQADHTQPVPGMTQGVIPYITLHGYDPAPYAIQSAAVSYSSCTIAAGIDAAGRLVTITSSADVAGEATGGLGSLTTDISFMGQTKAAYTFTYAY